PAEEPCLRFEPRRNRLERGRRVSQVREELPPFALIAQEVPDRALAALDQLEHVIEAPGGALHRAKRLARVVTVLDELADHALPVLDRIEHARGLLERRIDVLDRLLAEVGVAGLDDLPDQTFALVDAR